jgi:3-hydroxyacyl-CoA dehydrogenase
MTQNFKLRRIGIIGLGLMGTGIAQVAATANYVVTPCLFEAIRSLSSGLAPVNDIDAAMLRGCEHSGILAYKARCSADGSNRGSLL